MQATTMLMQLELPQLSSSLDAVLSPQYPSQVSSLAFHDGLPSPLSKELNVFPGVRQPSLSAIPAHRRRRPSKSHTPANMKRSASTPNVRGQAAADAVALSLAADKRRNKLGYHRTSVACGHCRRRKIRCLLAPEDPTSRCLNCIRLKKECNFFPVDQQPQPDSNRPGSKLDRASVETGSSSPSASPVTQGGSIHNHGDFNSIPSTQTTPQQTEFAIPHGVRQHSVPVNAYNVGSRLHAASQRPSLSHNHIAPVVTRGFDFNREEQRRASTWEGSPYDQSPISGEPKSALEDASTNYWRLAESPMTPAFSSYSGPSPMTPMRESVGTFSFSAAREDLGWPVPVSRSLSVGHFESYPRDYSSQYAIPAEFKPSQPTNIYPPSLNTSGVSMNSESLSIGAEMQPLPSNFGTQTGWNPSFIANTMNGMSKGADAFGGWYTEPGHLAQVEEEDSAVHFHEEPPIIYQHGAQSAA